MHESERELRAVVHSAHRSGFTAGRHCLFEQHAVTAFISVEEIRRQRVTAAVALAPLLVEDDPHDSLTDFGLTDIGLTELTLFGTQVLWG